MKLGRLFLLLTVAVMLLAPAQAQEKKKLAITKIAATDALTKRMAKQGVALSLAALLQAHA